MFYNLRKKSKYSAKHPLLKIIPKAISCACSAVIVGLLSAPTDSRAEENIRTNLSFPGESTSISSVFNRLGNLSQEGIQSGSGSEKSNLFTDSTSELKNVDLEEAVTIADWIASNKSPSDSKSGSKSGSKQILISPNKTVKAKTNQPGKEEWRSGLVFVSQITNLPETTVENFLRASKTGFILNQDTPTQNLTENNGIKDGTENSDQINPKAVQTHLALNDSLVKNESGRSVSVKTPHLESESESESASESESVSAQIKKTAIPSQIVLVKITQDKNGENQKLSFDPPVLNLEKEGANAAIKFEPGLDSKDLNIYVRDQAVVKLDRAKRILTAIKSGETEIFVLFKNKLSILPVKIKGPNLNQLTFEVPKDLTDFGALAGVGFVGSKRASISTPQALRKKPLSLDSVEKMAEMTLRNYSEQSRLYAKEEKEVGYTNATIQLIDERSVPTKGTVYPVGGVSVHLIGTEFSGKTNATGQIEIPNLPVGSRFLISIAGAENGYVSGISGFHSDMDGNTFNTQITVLRAFTHEMISKVAGVVQTEDSASLCGTVYDSEYYVLEGITVEIDQESDGPYYFNRFGYLDRAKGDTGPNGKFCYFNISQGPYALEISDSGSFPSLVPMNSFAGFHQEEEFILNSDGKIKTRLAAIATVHEQLNSDKLIADQYRPIDMIDIIPFGGADPLMQLEEGLVTNSEDLMFHKDRLFGFSQAAEFEPTVYGFDRSDHEGKGEHVTPLIPRGFVEDMSIYANVIYNPELGTVIAEHGIISGQGNGSSDIKLVDHRGRSVGEGWYFSDAPVTKAIFFNLSPGKYSIMVETNEGYWLAADTVFVYNETVSYMRLGARTRYR